MDIHIVSKNMLGRIMVSVCKHKTKIKLNKRINFFELRYRGLNWSHSSVSLLVFARVLSWMYVYTYECMCIHLNVYIYICINLYMPILIFLIFWIFYFIKYTSQWFNCPPPSPLLCCQLSSPLVTTSHFSVSVSLILFCSFCFALFLYSTDKWNHIVFVLSTWLILLSIWIPLDPSMLWQMADFFFLWLTNIPLCIYIPPLLFPFIYWWTLRLLPYLGYCKQWSNKHRGAYIFLN